MNYLLLLSAAAVAILTSCTVPGKYTRLDYTGASGGYQVLAESPKGAEIEAFTVEYHFMPEAELAAKKAKRHFLKAAGAVAKKRGQNATSVVITEGDITRNALAGTYKTVLTGIVAYGTAPPATHVIDRSLLGDLADSSARKSWAVIEGSAAASASLQDSIRETNRNNRIDSLNYSIDRNTRAVNDLERSVLRGY